MILAVLGLLVLVCLAGIKITVGMREKFFWRISVFGIPIPAKLFGGRKKEDRRKEHKPPSEKKKAKRRKKPEKVAADREPKAKKSPGDMLSLVLELAETALKAFPRVFRVRLHSLKITVGGSEAADIAVNYGRLYALTEGSLAVLDGYKGFLYGFKANRRRISLSADFLSTKTKIEFKVTLSFFVWQLLNAAARVGFKYILHTLKGENEG